MGRVPNCESVLVHKTNQIMTKMRSFSKPLTDLPIRKWVVVFFTCPCMNILTNSIIIIKNKKYHSPRAMYYKKIMNNYWNKDTNKFISHLFYVFSTFVENDVFVFLRFFSVFATSTIVDFFIISGSFSDKWYL